MSARTSPAATRRGRCAGGRDRCPGRTATTVASIGSVSPASRTWIVVAPSTTWAFVSISPSADTMTPVPTARPSWTSELIVTIDGPTASTTARTGSRPPIEPPAAIRRCRRRARVAVADRHADEHAGDPGDEGGGTDRGDRRPAPRPVGRSRRARRLRLDPGRGRREHRHLPVLPARRRLAASGHGADVVGASRPPSWSCAASGVGPQLEPVGAVHEGQDRAVDGDGRGAGQHGQHRAARPAGRWGRRRPSGSWRSART